MSLVHYSNADSITAESRDQDEKPRFKPRGFWVSDESDETSWSRWCADEDYGIGRNAFTVTLADDANVLWLRSESEVIAFNAEFGGDRYNLRDGMRDYVDWARVAQRWSGVFITPYQWSLRLSSVVGWYYPWDCASGCVWDAAAIASVAPQLDAQAVAS